MMMTILTIQKYYNKILILQQNAICNVFIARFLQYSRNLSNSFINIFEILKDFNEVFSKYSLNITVLCG